MKEAVAKAEGDEGRLINFEDETVVSEAANEDLVDISFLWKQLSQFVLCKRSVILVATDDEF
jgi:hypothetical protein